MLNSTQAFIGPLERWLRAIREDDFDAAMACLDDLCRDGRMLARHPEFRQRFAERSGGSEEPEHGLGLLCEYLRCATEGRAIFLDSFIRRYTGEPRVL